MLFKNKRTGEVVEFIERIPEKLEELTDSDRVYFNAHVLTRKYVYAADWEKDYELLGEGELCPTRGTPLMDVEPFDDLI